MVLGGRSGCAGVGDVGRQRDASRLEQRADDAGSGRAQGHRPAILADRHLLEAIKVAQHIAPLGPKAHLPAALIQLLAQDQRQEGTEHVASDGGIRGMVDGSCAHQRFGGPKELLHLDQVAVAQDRLQGRDPGIGAQHEQAIVARLLGQLARVDLEGRLGGRAEVAAIGGVADQRLGAPLELLIQGLDNGAAVGGVLLGFGLVAAHDVALTLDLDLLDEELGLLTAGPRDAQGSPPARGMHKGVNGLSSASTTVRTRLSVRSRAPSTYSRPRSSRAAMVGAEIMPRSATTQTRPMPKRLRRRSMTGTSTLTSAVLP